MGTKSRLEEVRPAKHQHNINWLEPDCRVILLATIGVATTKATICFLLELHEGTMAGIISETHICIIVVEHMPHGRVILGLNTVWC